MLARALDLIQWPFAPRRGSDRRLGSKFTRRLLHIMLILSFLSIVSYVLCMKNARPDIRIPQRPIYSYAPGRGTNLHIHDPSIVSVDGTYYAYGHGEHIPIHQAPNLDGPWTHAGSVLDHDSIIEKGNRKLLWAPTTVEVDGIFYCYYSVSRPGSRDSAVGVATSASPGPGGWTDHGVVVQSGTGEGTSSHPFDISNAIDPSAIVVNGQGYLNFGSYWTGIWQVPLNWDLVSAATQAGGKSARHLAFEPWAVFPRSKSTNPLYGDPTGGHPVEGAFISYHAPYYYLWYSWGKCCDFNPKHLPIRGNEYSIRVGRSSSPRGPFVDRNGEDLTRGGGEIIYGSNGDIYAPGGQGVLTVDGIDILYYHYLNRTISYAHKEARLGYNLLAYVDGWPIAL
ncbi:arabinan endo-1,5-alpha-L-arabinosidase [Aspergillus candidus]|uniref:Arabinan endo-1,5-alpha-L-arabinosidase n=1 Tax=Aspergillus candidus TaxID=41067 RepID=A0A2I2FI25_ASPCN|nr:glycosyl hydrolase [Aspergillus candidus]PLB40285.1 glycosyl hydrolase [Aspergillus candidus]